MGQEVACTIRLKKRQFDGTAYLETDHVLLRGEERLKVPFREIVRIEANSGILHLDFPGGPAELELGARAQKWADKILNPPSRGQKLGLKPGIEIRTVGEFDADFVAELTSSGVQTAKGNADLIFFAVTDRAELTRIPKLIPKLKPEGGLWVIYPKGIQAIREIDVISAGRAASLKDSKVASFSPTHTGLKFVIPLELRPPRS